MSSLRHHLPSSSITAPRLPSPSRLLNSTPGLRNFSPLASAIDRHSRPLERQDEAAKAEVSRRQLIVGLHVAAAASLFSPQLLSAALAESERVHLPVDPVLLGNHSVPDDLNHDVYMAAYKEGRPRFFDTEAKRLCWEKAKPVPGRDPDRWRMDAIGNVVCKRLHTCNGCLCYEFDHITPFSKGGESVADNCQVLQTRVNRLKSDKGGLNERALRGYSCNILFDDGELDAIEMAVYGSVNRAGKQCVVGSVDDVNLAKRVAKKQFFTTCG